MVKLLRNVKDSHLITLLTRWHLVHVHSLLHFLFIGSEMTSFFNSILRGREQIVSLLVYLDTKETKRLLKRGTVYGWWVVIKDWHRPIHKNHQDAKTCFFSLSVRFDSCPRNEEDWLRLSLRLRSERLGLSDWRSRSRGKRLLTIWTYRGWTLDTLPTRYTYETQQSFVS